MGIKNLAKATTIQPGSINGLKMILGAALVVLGGQVAVLSDLMATLPQFEGGIVHILYYLNITIELVEWALKITGNGLISVGFLHKLLKFFKKVPMV